MRDDVTDLERERLEAALLGGFHRLMRVALARMALCVGRELSADRALAVALESRADAFPAARR